MSAVQDREGGAAGVRPRAQDWPIGAALLPFPGALPDGTPVSRAPVDQWRQVLTEVRAAGFDHVDLTDSWLSPAELDQTRLTQLGELLAELGLGVSAISLTRRSVIDPDPQTADRNLQHTLRSVEAASALGVGVLCVGLHRPLTAAQRAAHWFWLATGEVDPVQDEHARAVAVQRLRLVGEHARRHGVLVSLELYEDTFLGTAASCVRMVQEIGLDNVGLNPDVGNLVRLHRPVEHWADVLAQTLPYTNYWHVKNYLRDEDPATGGYATFPAPMETGFIDYRLAMQMALDARFSGPLCVEHYGGDGLSVAALNRDYLRRLLTVKLAACR